MLPFFSYALHPVFIPIFASLLYFWLDLNAFNLNQKYLILLQVAIVTFFIPICLFFLLRSLGKIHSVMLSKPIERKWPLFIQIALFYVLATKSLTQETVPEMHYFFLAAMITALICLVLAQFDRKPSLHLAGISALIAFAIGLSVHNAINSIALIACLVFICGIVASSRLQMKAHTHMELSVGFILGLAPQLAFWPMWL